MDKVTLYRNSKHGISRWSIWHVGPTIYMESESKIGDTPTRFTEQVHGGKAGRSLQQQIDLRMKARIRGKKDNGYVDTYEEAQKSDLRNTMGFYQPMLAQKFQDLKKFNEEDYYVQYKLDGHRCLITRDGSDLIAYSRRGRPITTINHILQYIDIPDGFTFDGELYVHGQPLQTIASWAKRLQANSRKLTYVIYDIIEDVPYEERLRILFDEFYPRLINKPNISVLPSMKLNGEVDRPLPKLLRTSRDEGYEGLILRHKDFPYEIGRRSRGLIKVKETLDAEYEVVDVTPSKDDWGILHCKLPNGTTFKVSAPGTVYDKREVLHNKSKYIGKFVTVEFANLTKDGVPFHPVATRWRTDL